MNLYPILPFVHHLLKKSVKQGDIVIDATVGNGNDTVMLAELIGHDGHVFGFDIQQEAIENTKKLLREKELDQSVTLIHNGHEYVSDYLPVEFMGKVSATIFNLGYLPKGDKQIITRPETTISAVKQILKLLKVGGVIILVVYHGHIGGETERDELITYTSALSQEDFHVLQYSFINQRNNPPFIIAIEKR